MVQVVFDLIMKTAPTILAGFASLLLAALLGHRIANYWTYRRKKRELLLSAATDFYSSYGEFYALWKLWNHHKLNNTVMMDDARHWEMLGRVCKAEAILESMLVRLTSERQLSSDDIQILGAWRSVYHTLRYAIEQNQPLPWYSSDNPQYFQFKSLAPKVAALILGEKIPGSLEAGSLESPMYTITSGAWRKNEVKSDEESLLNKADAGDGK
jgi:hypothetical protein